MEYNVNSLKITAVNQVDKKNEKKMENNFFDIYAFVLGSINFFFYNNHLEKRMVKIGQEMRFLAMFEIS